MKRARERADMRRLRPDVRAMEATIARLEAELAEARAGLAHLAGIIDIFLKDQPWGAFVGALMEDGVLKEARALAEVRRAPGADGGGDSD
jgi:hypothetical protein